MGNQFNYHEWHAEKGQPLNVKPALAARDGKKHQERRKDESGDSRPQGFLRKRLVMHDG